jgi:uncharacterized protein (DUF58 family)
MEFHSAAHERKHEPHRSELAVTAAASIANAVYLLGQQIGLVTNGRDPPTDLPEGRPTLSFARCSLARMRNQ